MTACKVLIVALLAAVGPSNGFVVPSHHAVSPSTTIGTRSTQQHVVHVVTDLTSKFTGTSTSTAAGLRMAGDSDNGGGILTKVALAGVLFVFLLTSILPFLSEMQADGPANLSGAVATRDTPESYKGYENNYDRLSRANIQEIMVPITRSISA